MNYIRHLFPKIRVRLPAAALTVAVGFAFACSESPTEATLDDLAPRFHHRMGHDGGPVDGEDPPTATVVINTVEQGAGIYGAATNSYSATLGSGDLKVSIDCPDGAIELDLTDELLDSPFNAEIFTCAGGKGKSSASPRITVQNLLGADLDEILGAETPHDGTNYSNVTNYYFVVGRTGYNVIYWNGIRVTGIVDDNCPDGTRTYTLSTDSDTDPDLFDVELRERTKGGTVHLGDVAAHLDMTVAVTPCA